MDYIPNNFKSLSDLFDCTLSDLKNSMALWDDLVIKITRLHAALRGVVQANSGFLESFQRIADLATNSSGLISKDIGTTLTRLSLRQRSMHIKLKTMNENMSCRVIDPMQQRLDEWKKYNFQLDKDRVKETRRAKNELRKATEERNRLQRKAIKRGSMKGLGPLQMQVEVALKEAADKYQALENIEYECVRRVLIEERSRFCYFVECLMSVLDCQLDMFSELQGLEEVKTQITSLTDSPNQLTQASEDLIKSIMRPPPVSSMSNADAVLAAAAAASNFAYGSGSDDVPSQQLHQVQQSESSDVGNNSSGDNSLLSSSRKSSVLSINSDASSGGHSGHNNINNKLPSGRQRSRSESPGNNVIQEHEMDSDDKADILMPPPDMSPSEIPMSSTSNWLPAGTNNNISGGPQVVNCPAAANIGYDVTLKRPITKASISCNAAIEVDNGGGGGHCELSSALANFNLTGPPDTPSVNAQYSALYKLNHHGNSGTMTMTCANNSIAVCGGGGGGGNDNGGGGFQYPLEYNSSTLSYSNTTGRQPRRMTLPELPTSSKNNNNNNHNNSINRHPHIVNTIGNSSKHGEGLCDSLGQIDELRQSVNYDNDDLMPLPPPPPPISNDSVEHNEISAVTTTITTTSQSSVAVPPAPPPPTAIPPPPITLFSGGNNKSYNNGGGMKSTVTVPPPPGPPPPPAPPAPPVQPPIPIIYRPKKQ